jgi:hypothetical protein
MQTSTIKQIRAQIMQTKSQYYRLQICYVVSGYKVNHTSNGFRVKLICHHVLLQNTLGTIHLKKQIKSGKLTNNYRKPSITPSGNLFYWQKFTSIGLIINSMTNNVVIIWKTKKYAIFPKSNRKIVERGKIDTHNIQIYERSLSWLGTVA